MPSHDNYDIDILKQLKRIANALEELSKIRRTEVKTDLGSGWCVPENLFKSLNTEYKKERSDIIAEIIGDSNELTMKDWEMGRNKLMVDCSNCLRKDECDLYIESQGNVNKETCMCKTWRDEDGHLDNNTKRFLNGEELK